MPLTQLLGKKIGMTQVFQEDGRAEPVTAIQAGPCTITQVKTMANDKYESVQVGFDEVKGLNKPEAGHMRRAGRLFRHLREFRVADLSELQVGQEIDVSMFEPGELVDVVGTSKGRGFQGGVKLHHFAGGPKTHGQSDRHRAPGSIGAGTFPGRVWKGTRMAAHMGNVRKTVKSLEVIQVDPERNLLFLRGGVPGGKGSLLILKKSRRQRKG